MVRLVRAMCSLLIVMYENASFRPLKLKRVDARPAEGYDMGEVSAPAGYYLLEVITGVGVNQIIHFSGFFRGSESE